MGEIRRDERFERAFRAYYPRACRVAQRITADAAVAEELAAEAMARMFAAWPKLAGADYLEAWVVRVTANLALNTVRRRPPRLERPAAVDPHDAAAVRLGLVAALSALPDRQRDAVTLRYLGDFSEADVARALGVSAGTVKTHLHRGLTHLRRLLGDAPEEVPVVLAKL